MEEPKEEKNSAEKGEGTPVCIRCFRPVDPLQYYCPHCGEATGRFTQYMPFVNIQWQASVWGRMWRQVWSRDVSLLGRLFRLLMIIWKVPILFIGVFFRPDKKSQDSQQDIADPNEGLQGNSTR